MCYMVSIVVIINISSGYILVIINISSGYILVMINISSGYILVIINISSGNILGNLGTGVKSNFYPTELWAG